VIDHVVETLPVAEGAYFQPLTDDYLKLLRAILEHAPHVEHLRGKKWRNLVDFLIQGLSHYALEEDNPSSGTNASSLSQTSRSGHVASFRTSQSSGARASRHEAGRSAEDLFFCLDLLTSDTNAPVTSKATLVLDFLIRFLNSTSSSGSLHQIAVSCLNNILSRIVTEDTRLAQKVVLELLPAIRRLWSSKNPLLRDEILITLVLSRDTITALPKTNLRDDVHSSLSNLFEIVAAEYSRRNDRDILQLDEIQFTNDLRQQVMSLDHFCIRAERTRGTFNWATISAIAFLALTVDRLNQMAQKGRANETPTKRRKLANGVDDMLRESISASTMIRIRALQTIPFLLNESPAVSENCITFIAQFTKQILDEDPTIASWTMIAISRQV
jgi:serine-protein kinase ATM